jgi:hypothetical protein
VCDGAGACVQCLSAADCPADAVCTLMHTCVGICMDGLQDGTETDVDCGGSFCSPCAVGKKCLVDADCTSKACDAFSHVCVSSQCADHQQDGAETDIDCGGGICPPCFAGQKCLIDSDCVFGACDATTHVCIMDNLCGDHVKDGMETDVDCGGPICQPCPLGNSCLVDTDCTSNACDAVTLICLSSQCIDQHQDGAETDVDCGGGTCPACAAGKKCNLSSDCQAGLSCSASHVCM